MRHIGKPAFEELSAGLTTIVGALLGVMIGISALPYYSFGIFLSAIETTEHWPRTEIALAQTVWALALAGASPAVGFLIDKFGFRRPVALSFLVMALCQVAIALFARSPIVFIILYACMALGGSATSPLPFAKIIAARFTAARGIALGITLAGTGVATFIAPRFLAAIISEHGWRGGYMALALTVAVVTPIVLLLTRGHSTVAKADVRRTEGLSFREACRSRTFWQLNVAFALVTLSSAGLIAHMVPILRASGASPADAAAVLSWVGLSIVVARLTIGLLIDILPVRFVAAAVFAFTATGIFALKSLGVGAAPLTALGLGFALGAEVDLMGYCTARYFGFRDYGTIYGVQYGLSIVGVALSPAWMGWMASGGSYSIVLTVAAVGTAIGCVVAGALPRDRRANWTAPDVMPA
jgi:predicted MFS family arabinose efflux permease